MVSQVFVCRLVRNNNNHNNPIISRGQVKAHADENIAVVYGFMLSKKRLLERFLNDGFLETKTYP